MTSFSRRLVLVADYVVLTAKKSDVSTFVVVASIEYISGRDCSFVVRFVCLVEPSFSFSASSSFYRA